MIVPGARLLAVDSATLRELWIDERGNFWSNLQGEDLQPIETVTIRQDPCRTSIVVALAGKPTLRAVS